MRQQKVVIVLRKAVGDAAQHVQITGSFLVEQPLHVAADDHEWIFV